MPSTGAPAVPADTSADKPITATSPSIPPAPPAPPYSIASLRRILADLRSPVHGCAWDLEQSFATIAPYTIEEAYEVADAIGAADMPALQDELGDLL
ncbi:MAG: MazG nucleotide pyrophosphohydrolase domain-containing protein, partial [Sphingopyxis sp.]